MAKTNFKNGIKDGLPIGLGYLSVSFAFGVQASIAGIPIFMSVFIIVVSVAFWSGIVLLDRLCLINSLRNLLLGSLCVCRSVLSGLMIAVVIFMIVFVMMLVALMICIGRAVLLLGSIGFCLLL